MYLQLHNWLTVHLADRSRDGKITLRGFLNKQDVRVRSAFRRSSAGVL
jgi:hypothetical protein